MNKKEEIVKEFAKYCAQCHGRCCRRGVFSVFGWEAEKLSREITDFKTAAVSDERGTSKDIAISGLCMFSKENGCRLPVRLRPADCLTYPFYPKLKEMDGKLQIDSFVIDKECPFHNEIAQNEVLLKEVEDYWSRLDNKVNGQEISDWLGKDGSWQEWYENAISVKCNHCKNHNK
jgi:hypothetical protein